MHTLQHIKQTWEGMHERFGCLYLQEYTSPLLTERVKTELLALQWLTKRTARHEYFMAQTPRTYSYAGSDEYQSQPFSPLVASLMFGTNAILGTQHNVCFLNKYDDQHQHLGWHADDFPGMDPEEPISVISYGAEREIWLKDQRGIAVPCYLCGGSGKRTTETMARYGDEGIPCDACGSSGKVWGKGDVPLDQRVLLQDGSLFVMPPGYQDTHFHRIPKHSRPCSWRISLTFRTFKP